MKKAGYVYILKDDHFKRGVKIGKAMDVEKRMKPGLETMEENVDNLVA